MQERPFGITGSLHVGPGDGKARGDDAMDAVPPTRPERDSLLAAVRHHLKTRSAVPPFSVSELRAHSAAVLAAAGAGEKYRKFVAVLVSNETWRPAVAAVPFSRRLLLLPKCLRLEKECAGSIDEFGLLCAGCGRCPINDFKAEAEHLGYAVLVAEGAAIVMALIRSRNIEAVVGVSCLSALEAIYPLMESAAIPGIAIPLLCSGCANTVVDADWVWESIRLTSTEGRQRVDLEALRGDVEGWFAPGKIEAALGPADSRTEEIARQWLAKSGKRWRPLLVAAAYQALREDPDAPSPESLRKIAIAVECFHKASLIHDDIEDDDAFRYGEKTLHEQYGVPFALNAGDFLLGEGYRLIAESRWPPERKSEMLRAAATGHRDLSVGQGAELWWTRRPGSLTSAEVIDIFRRKTAPAFEVALRLGALAAGEDDGVRDVLHRYSVALGIAYQISDDLKDYSGDGDPGDLAAMRPSILLAIAHERASGDALKFLDAVWQRTLSPAENAAEVRRLMESLKVPQVARRLLASYQEEAIRSLEPLGCDALKGLLRRVIFRIFGRLGLGDSFGEPEGRHAPGGDAGQDAAR
jgi:geranylgeranyl diphosphate synthase type II